MRFSLSKSIAFSGLLGLFGLAAVASSGDAVLEKIKSLEKSDGVMALSSEQFKEFTSTPRKFSMVVALTVLGEAYNCAPCQALDSSLKKIGKKLQSGENKDKLFLGSLDYTEGAEIFRKYELTGAPNLYFFPASDDVSNDPAHKVYHGSNGPQAIDEIVDFLNNQLDFKVSYDKPIDWEYYGTKAGYALGFITVAFLFITKFKKVITSKRSWSAGTIVFIFTMMSGQMWNSIRGAEYMKARGDGSIEWYSGNYNSQFGLESHIVAVAYGIGAYAIIFLGRTGPTLKNPYLQSALSIAFLALFVGTFGFFLYLFKLKMSHYPFQVLPFLK